MPQSARLHLNLDMSDFRVVDRRSSFDTPSFHASLPIRPPSYQPTHPHTPPESQSGSPKLQTQGKKECCPEASQSLTSCSDSHLRSPVESSPLYRLPRPQFSASAPTKLPSLVEFDQGVEALARCNPPPPPVPQQRVEAPHRQRPCNRLFTPGPFPAYLLSQGTEPPATTASYGGDCAGIAPTYIDGYPSPPPEADSKRINQKYTVEEGDYIIYAWHDKKLKWTRIEQEFADLFGRQPRRTASGLQAWYYRMNQRIPVWDREGWLVFAAEEDLDPKTVSIKCRESQERPLGLAQRYPERAIQYPWVDAELKLKAHDWGECDSLLLIQAFLRLLTSNSDQARCPISPAERKEKAQRAGTGSSQAVMRQYSPSRPHNNLLPSNFLANHSLVLTLTHTYQFYIDSFLLYRLQFITST